MLGASAPSKKLALGVIGCGRIAHSYNVPSCLKDGGKDVCDFIALSDVDLTRVRSMRQKLAGKNMQGRDLVADSRCYQDYRKLLADPAIPFGYKLTGGNVGVAGKKVTLPYYMAMFLQPMVAAAG